MAVCQHCGKTIPYEQCAVDFSFFRTIRDMTDDEKEIYPLVMSKDYNEMRYTQNFIATCLCYDCVKELEKDLMRFVNLDE